jgi:hypothetical protein
MIGGGSPEAAVNNFGYTNGVLEQAIVPDAQGIQVKTDIYDQLWSFCLILDDVGQSIARNRYGAPKSRVVLNGYFLDAEPINPQTGTPNPVSRLLFTHESSATIQTRITNQGPVMNPVIKSNDFILPIADKEIIGADATMCDVETVAQCVHSDGGGELIASNGAGFVGTLHEQTARAFNSTAVSPRHQLKLIGSALENSQTAAGQFGNIRNSIAGEYTVPSDPFTTFVENMGRQMQSMPYHGRGQVAGDTTVTLGELSHMFNGDLPIHIMNNKRADPSIPMSDRGYDVRPQDIISRENQMSSLISNCVASFASECMLAGLVFDYTSWSNTGAPFWQINSVASLIGDVDPRTLNGLLDLFRRNFDDSVTPIIRSMMGEFSCSVSYDMTGACLVDLNLLDYSTHDGAMYETHQRLGGLIAPIIGNEHTLDNNIDNYRQLQQVAATHLA